MGERAKLLVVLFGWVSDICQELRDFDAGQAVYEFVVPAHGD